MRGQVDHDVPTSCFVLSRSPSAALQVYAQRLSFGLVAVGLIECLLQKSESLVARLHLVQQFFNAVTAQHLRGVCYEGIVHLLHSGVEQDGVGFSFRRVSFFALQVVVDLLGIYVAEALSGAISEVTFRQIVFQLGQCAAHAVPGVKVAALESLVVFGDGLQVEAVFGHPLVSLCFFQVFHQGVKLLVTSPAGNPQVGFSCRIVSVHGQVDVVRVPSAQSERVDIPSHLSFAHGPSRVAQRVEAVAVELGKRVGGGMFRTANGS